MTDQHESAISDPRANLQNFSTRQESAFQYGDPSKYQADVTKTKIHRQSDHPMTLISFCISRVNRNPARK